MQHTIEIKKSGDTVTFKLEQKGRTFRVLDARVEGRDDLAIGFDPKGVDEVLDKGSDSLQVFNVANKVRVGDCILDVLEMRAPDVQSLRLALNKVKLRFWNPEEI